MTTLSLPASFRMARAEFGLQSNTQAFESPLTRVTQTVELAGARWAGVYSLPPLVRADADLWRAFFAKLRGQAGRFYAGDPGYTTARGTATGTPLVKGASQTGASLATDGWTTGVTGIMKAGDYIAIDVGSTRHLYIVVADANSDGSGNATLTIEPPLRASPADNATIIVDTPTCVMRLVDDDQAKWSISEALHYGFSFAAVEALG